MMRYRSIAQACLAIPVLVSCSDPTPKKAEIGVYGIQVIPASASLGDPVSIVASLSAQAVHYDAYGLDLETTAGSPHVTVHGWLIEVTNPGPGPDFLPAEKFVPPFVATSSNVFIPESRGTWQIRSSRCSPPSPAPTGQAKYSTQDLRGCDASLVVQ